MEENQSMEKTESRLSNRRKNRDVDGGWAWVVLFAFFGSNIIASGLFYSFSIYYVSLLEYFGASRSTTAWVGSVNSGVFMMAGPLATLCVRSIGIRATIMLGGVVASAGYIGSALAPNIVTLFFTYGLTAGFGCCLNYTAWFIAISRYFDRYKSLALSLASSGVGIGIFVLGPGFHSVITEYGWRSSFLMSAGCALQFCVFGALIYPLSGEIPAEKSKAPGEECEICQATKCREHELLLVEQDLDKKERVMSTKESFQDACCWCLHISNFFWLGATITVYVFLNDFVKILRLDDYFILAFTAVGAGDLIGRVTTGFIIKITGIDPAVFMILASGVCAVSIVLLLVVVDGVQLLVQIVIFGIAYGFQNILMVVLPSAIFGSQNMDLVLGYTFFFSGTGMLVAPPLAGFLMDATDSFTSVLLFAGAMEFIGCIFAVACWFFYLRNWKQGVLKLDG